MGGAIFTFVGGAGFSYLAWTLVMEELGAAGAVRPVVGEVPVVLQLLAEGLSNKELAQRLGFSDHTAKFHVNAILTKLGAQSRTDAVVRAARIPTMPTRTPSSA